MNMIDKLGALREQMRQHRVNAYLVPRSDEHLGEGVPASAERLAWLSGFTGSAGLALVLMEKAAIFSDGRYVLQISHQTDPAHWERLHVLKSPPPHWLASMLPGARLGYDPRLVTPQAMAKYMELGVEPVVIDQNLVDAVWVDRPAAPLNPLVPHALEFAGVASDDKRQALAERLQKAGQNCAIIIDPASICWLFNIRGADLPYTPFALAFAVLHDDGHAELFVDPRKVTPEIRAWLGNGVSVRAPGEMQAALAALSGKSVRFDEDTQPAWFSQELEAAGAVQSRGEDICALPKACKNATEQAGMRAAHVRDGAALCRFIAHMEQAGPAESESEISAAEKLAAFRAQAPEYRGEAFSAISGAGEHGAIIHYRATAQSDRQIKRDELYLIDSGGQYLDGTTDVTRTLWTGSGRPPAEMRDRYTRVLKGLIAIATTIFPEGTVGAHLDALARTALWQVGLDFDHGTGHGIGSYLSVHEGPASISRPLRPAPLEAGMIMSDEPGYYLPGHYGIRLENIVLISPANGIGRADRGFLKFETITLAPFQRRLIEPALLNPAEIAWVDAYHARVVAEVSPLLDASIVSWLERVCAPLAAGADNNGFSANKECSA